MQSITRSLLVPRCSFILARQSRAAYSIPKKIRHYAAVSQDSPPVTETNKAEAAMKRFWTTANVNSHDDFVEVTLDGRPLKTPDGNKLRLPKQKRLFAALIANEWDVQDKILKPHTLPLTSIASRAIDGLGSKEDRLAVANTLLKYFDTDAVCYHESEPERLVKLQRRHWGPLLEWARDSQGIEARTFGSVLLGAQSSEAKEKLLSHILEFDQWEMAAFERAVYTTKSTIIALALMKKRLSVEEASQAAHVEVNSQIQRWGEVEDSHDVDYHDIRRQLGSVACAI